MKGQTHAMPDAAIKRHPKATSLLQAEEEN